MSCLLVLSTFPDPGSAQKAATILVEERLAACVNIVPGVVSIYRWQDRIECESELTAFIKTTEETFPKLEERLITLHPYEVPEIVALPIRGGLSSYLQWVEAESTPAPPVLPAQGDAAAPQVNPGRPPEKAEDV